MSSIYVQTLGLEELALKPVILLIRRYFIGVFINKVFYIWWYLDLLVLDCLWRGVSSVYKQIFAVANRITITSLFQKIPKDI